MSEQRTPRDILGYWAERVHSSLTPNSIYASESEALREFYRDAQNFARGEHQGGDPEVQLLLAIAGELTAKGHPDGTYDVLANMEPGRTIDRNLGVIVGRLWTRPRMKSRVLSYFERAEILRLRASAGARSTQGRQEFGSLENSLAARPASPPPRFALAHAIPGVLGNAIRLVRPQSLSRVAFPSVVERWAASDELCESMFQFHDSVVSLVRELEGQQVYTTGVWERALLCANNDPQQALEMITLAALGKTPLRYIQETSFSQNKISRHCIEAFSAAARTLNFLCLAHELSMNANGISAVYPAETRESSKKFWHFYAAALLSLTLLHQGHSKPAVAFAGALVASAYEGTSIPTNLRIHPIFRPHILLLEGLESIRDVHTQVAGSNFARRIWNVQGGPLKRSGIGAQQTQTAHQHHYPEPPRV